MRLLNFHVPSRWLLLGLCLIAPLIAAAQAPTAQAPTATKAAWTLMVYLDADNDLERPLMKNLEEMTKVGSTDAVNIIVLAARSPAGEGKYTNEGVANLPNWTSAKLLRVEPGKLTELADWGAQDMGDPAVLARFLKTVTQNYPAARYGLIFGDHGMAWAGVAVAESGDGDSLAIDEVTAAFQDTMPSTGRFELIGFDACVMSNLEVAKSLTPYARYLVASEEIEPADGWDYAALLTRLTRAPAMDGAALGRAIVDTYRDFYANSTQHKLREESKAITLALVDLDKVAPIAKAVTDLGAGVNVLLARGGHSAWVHVAHARHNAEEYGRSSAPPGVAVPGPVYDLVHLAQTLKQEAQDPASAAAAQAVIAAVGPAVLYNIHGEARPHANGLSIFFPPDQASLTVRGKNAYNETGFAQSSRWYPFLTTYAAVPASDAERHRAKPAIDPLATSGRMASPKGPVKIASQVHADDIEEASFVLALSQQGEQVIIGSIPVDLDAAGDLKEEWDGEWFTITDQQVELLAPITSFEELSDEHGEDRYWAGVPAQLRLRGTREWLDVTLSFLLDFQGEAVSGDFIYAVEYSKHGPREIDIEEGDELRPVYEVVNAAGEQSLSVVAGDEHVMHVSDVDDLKIARDAVPAGEYLAGFVVRDLAGRDTEQLVAIKVPAAGEAAESTSPKESAPASESAPDSEAPMESETPAAADEH